MSKERCCFCGKEIIGTKYLGLTSIAFTSSGLPIYLESYSCGECNKEAFEGLYKKEKEKENE